MEYLNSIHGPIPYSVFDPAPPTVGTTGTESKRWANLDTATMTTLLVIGGMFALFVILMLRSPVNSIAEDTESEIESESIEHLENRREAIDQITDNAVDSVQSISEETGEPAEVVTANTQASVDVIAGESIAQIQSVANQAKAEIGGSA